MQVLICKKANALACPSTGFRDHMLQDERRELPSLDREDDVWRMPAPSTQGQRNCMDPHGGKLARNSKP